MRKKQKKSLVFHTQLSSQIKRINKAEGLVLKQETATTEN